LGGAEMFIRDRGMGCDIIQKVERDGITISSTYIRNLVAQGEMERAAQFLGHPHILTQQVGRGKGIGHSALGFPTVNLRVPEGVIVPAFGVYATRVWFDGQSRPAVTNVGIRPTVADNDGRVTVEGFILDFDGDLYSHQVRMEFHRFLRGERRFPSMEALAREIRRNAEQTREYFGG
ncbi:MAG: riboflavin biosynthesis protein RibF, partial [Lawsonibacter sp.]|nr:riboflavin biosynthesis protein RibF [Lawsonibacter sp.]